MAREIADTSSFVRCLQERALNQFIKDLDIRFDFQKHIYRGITLVVINFSRAVIGESQIFYRYIFDIIDEGSKRIVVDLTSLEFIDSSFAGVLVAALRKVKANGGDIRLVVKSGNSLSNQMLFNGILKIYRTYTSIKEALDSFESQQVSSMSSTFHLSSQK